MSDQELATYEDRPLTLDQVKSQVDLIQNIMRSVMKQDEHYGVIPGTGNKPTLLKSGAEKLNMTFRMAPKFEGAQEPLDMGNGHREYVIKASLYSVSTGTFLGQGVGSCSTMEGKYRFRTGPVEFTGKPVPREYWDLRKSDPLQAQKLLGGKGFVPKKNESGVWEISMQGEKVEHDNPADYYNTVLKMAKKRALVDAVLTVTAASDIFTQDVEDMPEVIPQAEKKTSEKLPIQEPQKKQNGQPKEGESPKSLQATITVDKVTIQDKKKDGTAMKSPLYSIHSTNGVTYKTFDRNLADLASGEKGKQVEVFYEKDQYGNTLKGLSQVQAEIQQELPNG